MSMSEQKLQPPGKAPGPLKKTDRLKNPPSGCIGLLFGLMFVCALLLSISAGALAGYQTGGRERQATATKLSLLSLDQQYNLALQDIAEDRLDIARQRLEYVISLDPGYPGASARLAEAMAILYATATPTALPPTITPTPTRDLRPVQELLDQALTLWNSQDWTQAIDLLLTLRKSDPAYETARVDGMLFMALRYRGVDKIWKEGNLEGGLYDLALAERFGPLDAQSLSSRDLARLYMMGSSFYGVYPEEAIRYFSQLASAAPNLRDSSGVAAAVRYWDSLVQYGDQLMADKRPCDAQEQYGQALSWRSDSTVETKLREAMLACNPPTHTPRPPTATPFFTPSATNGLFPTETQAIPPTETQTLPTDTVPAATSTTGPPPVTSQPPTDTPQLPTETPVPPTETVMPPTETSAPPTTEAPPVTTEAPPASATPEPPTATQETSPTPLASTETIHPPALAITPLPTKEILP